MADHYMRDGVAYNAAGIPLDLTKVRVADGRFCGNALPHKPHTWDADGLTEPEIVRCGGVLERASEPDPAECQAEDHFCKCADPARTNVWDAVTSVALYAAVVAALYLLFLYKSGAFL